MTKFLPELPSSHEMRIITTSYIESIALHLRIGFSMSFLTLLIQSVPFPNAIGISRNRKSQSFSLSGFSRLFIKDYLVRQIYTGILVFSSAKFV